MKVGILTFHSQLNYGGVLQCWALQSALAEMGHDVVVIDRWMKRDNSTLYRGYANASLRNWCSMIIKSCLGAGSLAQWRRWVRTKRFISEHLHLSSYHFFSWTEAPADLCLDCLVVGSDQVWHMNSWSGPWAYLLEGAPDIPSIAYAASFGMKSIPRDLYERYYEGLRNFDAISCREAEGCKIVHDMGLDSTHVADPTLLQNDKWWRLAIGGKDICVQRKNLVCYFLSENVVAAYSEVEKFACKNKWHAEIFTIEGATLPIIRSLKDWRLRMGRTRVKFNLSAGPAEFLRAVMRADEVITDSFHGLMFACIFGKRIRFIRPRNEVRANMFSRIDEFVRKFTVGRVLVDDMDEALTLVANNSEVMYDRTRLDAWIAASRSWLKDNLERKLK